MFRFDSRAVRSSNSKEEVEMSIGSLLKRLTNALPVVLAAAPGVIDAARQVQQALKKPKKPAEETTGRLSADSERVAR
jgi:hypothetical protein